jgi:hypothetical protein
MFASACKNAKEFTFPIIISSRQFDGKCSTGIGTYIIINEEGWIVTAWHIVESIKQLIESNNSYNSSVSIRAQIESDDSLKKHEKMRELNKHKISPTAITNFSIFYGDPTLSVSNFSGIPEIDLAIGKLSNFNPTMVKVYPCFKDPIQGMEPGTSLCKLGFPFHEIKPTFDINSSAFNLPDGSLPVPLFPIEGIFTRNILISPIGVRQYELKYIETSSPGLRGQSGGPTFDVHGNIWAIQSSTRHLPLGFGGANNMTTKQKDILENQYLHVGWGVHSESIINFLKENNIKFNISL